MAKFLSQTLDDLTRQLAYAPPTRRRMHLDNAEQLYWQIDPDRNYPLEFISFRITGYRPDTAPAVTLAGTAVRRDLLVLVEQLSDSLDERAADFDPPPIDQQALARELRVSAKTLSRYRRQGLFARRIIFTARGNRKRIAFMPASVERFLDAQSPRLAKASGFSRIDDDTRHAVITRARRIAARVDASPFAVARHLARKYGRSVEAIRLLLLRHDRADPRVAIFPEHTPPLTERQQRVIHRAFHRGVPVARLAERFGKARNAIYRTLNRSRARAIAGLDIQYIYHWTFDLPDAEQVILESTLADNAATRAETHPPASITPRRSAGAKDDSGLSTYFRDLMDQVPLDAETERDLFVRYNYLKYLADNLRKELDVYQPASGDLDRVETYLRRAVTVKQRIVSASLRLVVATARRHLGAAGRIDPQALADLIAEGNLVLMETLETFDPGRDNRFSTYLTWALMRRFAQSQADATRQRAVALDVGDREYWPAAMDPTLAATEQAEQVAHTLATLLAELDDRERLIVTRHFGLADPEADGGAKARTLAELGDELDISPERARQIERRALRKLRESARRMGLSIPEADPLGRP